MPVPDFKKDLNPVQYGAVTYGDGPLLIVAGAGSGKTRILTYRIAHLVAQGTAPQRILAVTFTNKAADEMARRVDTLVKQYVPVLTFHSFCLRVLRQEVAHTTYQPNFVVYDKSDQLTVVKDCMRHVNVTEKQIKPKAISTAISRAKDKLMNAGQYAAAVDSYLDEAIANVYREYEAVLRKANAMDFDDLLMECVHLFAQHPDVLARYQERFVHMLVDEFQDTNHAQYVLMKQLVQQRRNISVVGDPDQSIYRFRGANIRNILDFEKDFPHAHVVVLEQNYRSTATILAAANQVIAHNVERKEKNLWTKNDTGVPIQIYRAADEQDEAHYITGVIRALQDGGQLASLRDAVIFYRVHALSRVLEDALRAARMPHVIVGDVSFYNRREIKDIVAYLRVVVNNADDVNVRRIVNVPARGIGETTQETIAKHARAHQLSFYGALERVADVAHLSGATRRNISAFTRLMQGLQKEAATLLPTQMINRVIDETGYLDALLESDDVQDRSRVENVRELISAAAEYENTCPDEKPSLEGFLQEIALTSELDKWNDTSSAVTLMTMHNAKGLEFPVVFMAGMEEDLFPHFNSLEDPTDIEEERRLCYVGMTRAEQRLTLTCAYHRTIFGQRKVREPSRFLSEIPAEHAETLVSAHHEALGAVEQPLPRGAARGKSVSAPPPANGDYKPGARVLHAHFGAGKIESVMGSGEDARLTIKFDSLPHPKVLVAKYAKLRVTK
jgi:DNA helicase-2/ATP-dependent DNA helicase PcrA